MARAGPAQARPGAARGLPALLAGTGLLLAAAGGALVASGAAQPARVERVGGNYPVNAGAGDLIDLHAHNSPAVARNPIEDDEVVIANRIDSPLFSCALHVSSDGGATFSQTPIPVPPGEEPKCFAPDVAFDAAGTMYLSFVTLRGSGNVPHAVWLVTSRDGGRTLGAPRRVAGELAFQVRLATHPRTPGLLYMTWLQARATATLSFPEAGYPIVAARSDDGGVTWSEPVQVNDPRRLRVVAPVPAVSFDGDLLVVFLDLKEDRLDYEGGHRGIGGPPYPGTWSLVAARAAGGSFEEHVVSDAITPIERFIVFLPPYPTVTIAPTDGRIYTAFHDGRSGDADVLLWSSRDGRAWSSPVRVNDTPSRDGSDQYLPAIDTAPTGRLDVVYYDRRADHDLNEVSYQASFDGGATFTPRVLLSEQPMDPRVGFGAERGLPDLGSRLAVLSAARGAMAVWTDTRAGTPESKKQDLMRALVRVFPPTPGPSPGAATLVRVGAGCTALAGSVLIGRGARRWLRSGRSARGGPPGSEG